MDNCKPPPLTGSKIYSILEIVIHRFQAVLRNLDDFTKNERNILAAANRLQEQKIVSDSKMYVKETWDCYLQKGNEDKRIS